MNIQNTAFTCAPVTMNPLAASYCKIYGVTYQFSYSKVNEKHLVNCFILKRSIFNKRNNCTSIYSRTPLIRTLVIRTADNPDRIVPSSKFVENSIKITFLEITGYQMKYSTVLWLIELQIRRVRKVQTRVHTVNSNSRTANCRCRQFLKNNPIIRNFCLSEWLAALFNPENWVLLYIQLLCYFTALCLVDLILLRMASRK